MQAERPAAAASCVSARFALLPVPLAFSRLVFSPQESPQAAALNIDRQFSSPIKLSTSPRGEAGRQQSSDRRSLRQLLVVFLRSAASISP